MEREEKEDQLYWVAMNPGYQGKKLIQGHYLDYLVDDVLYCNTLLSEQSHAYMHEGGNLPRQFSIVKTGQHRGNINSTNFYIQSQNQGGKCV